LAPYFERILAFLAVLVHDEPLCREGKAEGFDVGIRKEVPGTYHQTL
jgi:hypothetical protein